MLQKIELDDVFKKVFETVNILKKSGNFHQDFKNFLESDNADFTDVLYSTDVRWLSRTTCLKKFFDSLENIDKFFIDRNEKINQFSDSVWIFKSAFLVDVITMLNQLNLSMQGKNKFILESFNQVKNFKIKLTNLYEEIKDSEFC